MTRPAPEQNQRDLPNGLLDNVEVLRGREREISELSGGLTNRNFKVTTSEGSYVVRVSSRQSVELAINRDHEHQNSVIAASTGVGAPVVAYLPEHVVMVIGFIEGPTFTDESFSRPGNIERVAAACRRLHGGPKFVCDFDMFQIQRGYVDLVRHKGYRLPPTYLDFEGQVEQIRQALAVRREPAVPCNNDLLSGNLIDSSEGVRIIDYEYSGNNDACFELGNMWSECHLSVEQLEELVTSYYGRRLTNKIARAKLQGLMSQYGWTLWASIQDATSTIDFDFWRWGLEKFERAATTFTSSDFGRLIEDVQRPD
jgi:thiamine kinase-like enzyme